MRSVAENTRDCEHKYGAQNGARLKQCDRHLKLRPKNVN